LLALGDGGPERLDRHIEALTSMASILRPGSALFTSLARQTIYGSSGMTSPWLMGWF